MQLLEAHRRTVHSLAFSPDGARLATASNDQTVRLWDLRTGRSKLVRSNRGGQSGCERVAFSPDGRWLVTVDQRRVRVWDVAAGTLAHTFPPVSEHHGLEDFGEVRRFEFIPAANRFAAGGGPFNHGYWHVARFWDAGSWDATDSWPFPSTEFRPVPHVSADGRWMAATNLTTVDVWDLGDRVIRSCVRGYQRLLFSPDAEWLLGADGQRIHIYRPTNDECVAELTSSRKPFQDLAFSPDGRLLATVASDATVKFWDTATWRVVREYTWRVGALKCVRFAPDGLRTACAGQHGTVVVWDVDS